MTLRSAQVLLLSLLLVGLAIALGALWYGYSQQQYFDDEFERLVLMVIGEHAGPLSIVFAAFFAVDRTRRMRAIDWRMVSVAVALTTLWSLLTAGRAVAFVLSSDEIVETLVSWSAVVGGASFLVDGTLAYFFVSSANPS